MRSPRYVLNRMRRSIRGATDVVRAALPSACIGCGLSAGPAGICEVCLRALPWNLVACAHCGLPVSHSGICGACLLKPPAWDAACCAFRYEFPVVSLLQGFKFSRHLGTGRTLSVLFAQWVASTGCRRPAALVPVPLHWRRRLQRNFNQATEIARTVGHRLGIPVVEACRRVRATAAQTGLDAAQRRRNLRGAFTVVRPVDGHAIALVDDVLTTGVTATELTRVLRAAGAARIEIWTLARTLPPTQS